MTPQLSGSSSTRRSRILFVHNKLSRFVAMDMELLSERYDVREWYQRSRFVNIIGLLSAIWSVDLVFGWFASWHTIFPALLAKALKRPSVFVIGGYDTAEMHEIGYGNQRGGIPRWVTRAVIKNATRLVTNSHFTEKEAIDNAGAMGDSISVVYHGVRPIGDLEDLCKQDLVITVSNVDYCNLKRKGLEPFVRAAALIPDVQFVLIGKWLDRSIDHLRSISTKNVFFTGELSDEDLGRYYRKARVYVQASEHEGFGLALAEAMLAECAPVVTSVGSLPEVVGDCGIYVDSTEPETLAEAIKRALSLPIESGKRASSRIRTEFTLTRRREQLVKQIDAILQS